MMYRPMNVLHLRFRVPAEWRTARKAAEEAADANAADRTSLHASKEVMRASAVAYARGAARRARKRIGQLAVYNLGPAVHVFPQDAREIVDTELEQARMDFQRARSMLLAEWDDIRQDAQRRLGDLFDWSDYADPEEYANKFEVLASIYQFAPAPDPESRRQFDSVVEEIREGLRAGFAQAVAELKTRLDKVKRGETERITSGTFNVLREWLRLFDVRNVTDDEELADLVRRARNLISGVAPETLRTSPAQLSSLSDELGRVLGNAVEILPAERRTFEV